MQQISFGDKISIVGDLFLGLLKDLSFVQCLVLQLIVAMVVWMVMKGGAMLAAALPIWALALGSAGFATILLATFRMGFARIGLVAVGMCVTMMLSAGSASVVVQDSNRRPFGMPSLNDIALTYAWLMVIGGCIGGLAATAVYVAWARDRRNAKHEAHKTH
ncbi:TPA: hypothetical protein QDB11_005691 [Burkholderia vietnamiensis]|uniref:hypothetical protein n=1 Tax=Burkholderia vietnamiensis TaxID=60552 RepID=UPI0026555DDC|nr:hypothetical protein [Burkholderia vietnamiensis]MDN8114896.1 hypothetical protein [Burkholderia vietnamiensis]HDR9140958.1 hypothetical protein [Burkholderia vietnamiensis]